MYLLLYLNIIKINCLDENNQHKIIFFFFRAEVELLIKSEQFPVYKLEKKSPHYLYWNKIAI